MPASLAPSGESLGCGRSCVLGLCLHIRSPLCAVPGCCVCTSTAHHWPEHLSDPHLKVPNKLGFFCIPIDSLYVNILSFTMNQNVSWGGPKITTNHTSYGRNLCIFKVSILKILNCGVVHVQFLEIWGDWSNWMGLID